MEPVWRIGSRYILTPVYAGGWKMRFATMDDIKLPDTSWVRGQSSINFYSVPYEWPPEKVGDWVVRR